MNDMNLILFVISSVAFILTPGQDMVLVISRSVSQGRKAGIATAAGVGTGLLGHTILASLGLGALLQRSEILFTAIKLIGAGYLFYLGISLLVKKTKELHFEHYQSIPLIRLYFQGAVSNISNPKVAIFYFAYLPQFLSPADSQPTLHLIFLGTFFAFLTFIIKAPIGIAAGSLSSWLKTRKAVQAWMNRITGMVLIALGLKLSLEHRN